MKLLLFTVFPLTSLKLGFDPKEKQPDSQNENQAVKDELIAFYGDVKDDLTPDDIDDLMVAMRAKAERNKKKKSGV